MRGQVIDGEVVEVARHELDDIENLKIAPSRFVAAVGWACCSRSKRYHFMKPAFGLVQALRVKESRSRKK